MAKRPQVNCFPVARGRFTGLYVTEPKPTDSEGLCLTVERLPGASWAERFSHKVLIPLTNEDVARLREYFTRRKSNEHDSASA